MKSAHEEYISFWPASGSTTSQVSSSQTHRSGSTYRHRQGLHRRCPVLNKLHVLVKAASQAYV